MTVTRNNARPDGPVSPVSPVIVALDVGSRSEALANQLVGDLGEQLAMLDAARSTEALVTNQSLPQSELSLRSAMAAYENGKLDFTALLEAQRQIRKTRQDNLKAQAEAQMRLAEIERIVGEDL